MSHPTENPNTAVMASEPNWDTTATARFTGLSASTLNKMRVRGDGPQFLKIGRKVVKYRPADVRAWLSTRIRHSTSEAA